MKIGVLFKDERLKNELLAETQREKEEEWHFFEEPEQLMEDIRTSIYDRFFLSDRYFACDDLHDTIDEIRELQPGADLAVLLSNRHDAVQNEKFRKLCISQQLPAVYPGRSQSAVILEMLRLIRGEAMDGDRDRAGLAVFLGSTPNVGTTLVSFGTAVHIAQASTQSIGYLCLNLKSSKLHRYLGIDEPPAALDGLRAELKAGNLPADRLRRYCDKVRGLPNLYVLFGNTLREQAEFFKPADIHCLLEAAKSAFDFCIVEVNAYWDNAATVCAMMAADVRVMVTTPDITHFQEDVSRWWNTTAPLFGIPVESCDLIVNQLDKGAQTGGIRLKDIRRETGMSVIAEIGRHPEVVDFINQGKLLELLRGRHPINRSISRAGETLMAQCGVARTPIRTPEPWFKRMLAGARAGA